MKHGNLMMQANVVAAAMLLSQVYSFAVLPANFHASSFVQSKPLIKIRSLGLHQFKIGSLCLSSSNNNDNNKVDESNDGWEENTPAGSKTTTTPQRTTPKQEPERDLFIPIFALVSIAGFVGLYGYEMLRLYSRGELYLPF